MKVPSCVVWQCVKKNHAYLIKRGRDGEQWTKDPISLTGRHNASENGISNDHAISISARKETSKKTHRRVFDMKIRHSGHHDAKKTGGAVFSTTTVKKEVNRLAKVVNSLQGITELKRHKLLHRVHRLHSGNKHHQRGDNRPASE